MTDDASRISDAARLLAEAKRDGRTIDLLTAQFPDIDMPLAEKIAFATIALHGKPVIGIKLGFTSSAMRMQMNIGAPNFGWLTTEMDLTDRPADVEFVHPRIEPEIAVVLSRPIGHAHPAFEDAPGGIESVHAALEIVDTRFHNYDFTLIDNTADNSSAAGFILGPPNSPVGLIDRPLSVALRQGDKRVAHGLSSDAMGGPLIAVKWLAAALRERGLTLPAGAIILTGGLTAAPYLRAGETVSADLAGLGTVRFCL